jgi:HlyD family secretion protein
MADLAEMQVRAKIDETDVGQISPGMGAKVTVEAYPGKIFRGTIYKIEPQAVVEQNVTLFPVLIRLPNPEGLLRPGMNAEVTVEIAQRQDVPTIPNAAVSTMRDARSAASLLGVDEATLRKALHPAPKPETPAQPGQIQEAVAVAGDGCSELREKMKGAGGWQGLTDTDREKLKACREKNAGQGNGAGAGRQGKQDVRTGVIFVMGPTGPEPRLVTLGLSDWEYTEVLDGAKLGEKVVQISLAQLQKKQQEMTDRFRQGTGGMMPGGGGGRPPGGGR